MRFLVTGASGYVGSRLVAALTRGSDEVVVASRRPSKLAAFDWFDSVHSTELDVTDADSCDAAFDAAGHIDVAYYLVHAIGESNYRALDLRSARQFATAAAKAGVGRIVYLGGFVPAGEKLSEHLASRAEVGQALEVDGIDVVQLRAAIVIGAGSTSYEMLRYLADRLPILPLPHWLNNPVQPIAIDDVLHYLVESAASVPPGAYDIGGDDVMPYRDMLFSYIRAADLNRVGLPLFGIPKALAGMVIGKIIPVPDGLAADLVGSLSNTMTTSEDSIKKWVEDKPGGATTIDDAMARSLHGSAEDPPGVSALVDPLRLAKTDAPWTGGDELSIHRRGVELSSPQTWKLVEGLGVGSLLYSWPVAGLLRTNLDIASSIVSRAKSAARGSRRAEEGAVS